MIDFQLFLRYIIKTNINNINKIEILNIRNIHFNDTIFSLLCILHFSAFCKKMQPSSSLNTFSIDWMDVDSDLHTSHGDPMDLDVPIVLNADMAGTRLTVQTPQNVYIDVLNVLLHGGGVHFNTPQDLAIALNKKLFSLIRFCGRARVNLVMKEFAIGRYKASSLIAMLLISNNIHNATIYIAEDDSNDSERDDRILIALAESNNGVIISNDKFRSIGAHFNRSLNYMYVPIEELLGFWNGQHDDSLYNKIAVHVRAKMVIGGPHDLTLGQMQNCRARLHPYQITANGATILSPS